MLTFFLLFAKGPRYRPTPVQFRWAETIGAIFEPVPTFIATTTVSCSGTNTE